MKLNSGKIVINKPPESVYRFLSRLENLDKQLPKNPINDYVLEVDDDLSGEIEVGTVISFFMFAVYEGDDDRCIELEVVSLDKNRSIKLKLIYIGKYEEKKNDWSAPMPIDRLFGEMEFEMDFLDKNGKTQVLILSEFHTKSKVIKIILRLFSFFGRSLNRKYYKEWASLIEVNS